MLTGDNRGSPQTSLPDNFIEAITDHVVNGGSPQASLPDDAMDVLKDHVVESCQAAKDTIVRETETHWVSPAANHPPLLVKILNYVYRQHHLPSTFRWSPIKLNNRKHIWFLTSNRCSQNLL